MHQENRYSSEQLRQPVPLRSWDRASTGDRYRVQSHVLHRLAEDVSPVSAVSQETIAPSVPAKSFRRSEPYANIAYTRDSFAQRQPPAIPEVLAVKRKPVQASSQPVPPPLSTENLRNHDNISNEHQYPLHLSNKESPRWPYLIGNVSFLLIPVLFLALGLALGTLDGKPTNERRYWNTYQNLMQIVG